MTKTALLSALALLALPAAAQAATSEGSDLSAAPGDQTIACATTCTVAWDAEGWFDGDLDDDSIVTRWSAQLTPGTKARLRLLRREPGGAYTGAGASEQVTASGGVQTFTTHLAVPAGDYVLGLDVQGGGVGGQSDPDDEFGAERLIPALAHGETRSGTELAVQPLFGAQTETDYDADGRADESEDDCVYGCSPAGGGSSGGGAGTPSPSPAPADPAPSPSPRTTDTTSAEPEKPPFTIDARGLVRPGKQADQGWFDIFVANNGSGSLAAEITVKHGKRTVGTHKVDELESGDDESINFRLNAKETKELRRKGKLKLTVTAKAVREKGDTVDVKQALTVVTGGASKFDGEYRGPGPFVITVDHGAIRSVSTSVNAFCPKSNRFQMLSILSIDGFPVLIGKDGSFQGEGNVISQLVTYKGKLKLKGESKGYASAYKAQMNLSSDNRFYIDPCQGATNWTVKKVR
jgi:hypothetical protein